MTKRRQCVHLRNDKKKQYSGLTLRGVKLCDECANKALAAINGGQYAANP
jgi:hypothetical protein